MKILSVFLFTFFSVIVNAQNKQAKSDNAAIENEFLTGHVQTFKTVGHSKALGTDWSVTLPASWKASPAKGANIIQKFISKNGDGIEYIMLTINDIPMGNFLSQKDIDEMFTETEVKDMIPDDSKFLSFAKMVFDGIKGGVCHYEATTNVEGIEVTTRNTQYMFIFKGKIYMLVCGVPVGKGKLYTDPKNFNRLFDLVAKSITVNKQK